MRNVLRLARERPNSARRRALRDPEAPLIPISEGARLAGLPETTFRRLVVERHIPGLVVFPNHQRYVRRAVLLRWLEGQEAAGEEAGGA